MNQDEMNPHSSKVVPRIFYGALVIIAIAVSVFLYWSFQSTNILQIKNEPLPVEIVKQPDQPTSVIILKVDFCKHEGIGGKIRMSFLSTSREVFLPLQDELQPAGCGIRDIPVIVPLDLPADTYKIKFRATYEINPIRTVINEFVSKQFEIKPGETQ